MESPLAATEPILSVAPPLTHAPTASSPPCPQAGAGLTAARRRVPGCRLRRRVPGCRLATGTCRSGEVRGITAGRSRRADFAGEECWFRGRGMLVSRERTVGLTRRNQHSSPAKSGRCSYPGVAQHLAPQKPSPAPCRATAQRSPREHPAAQPHSTFRAGARLNGHFVGPPESSARMAEGMQPCRSREDGRRP
jgi:hypothetical protein